MSTLEEAASHVSLVACALLKHVSGAGKRCGKVRLPRGISRIGTHKVLRDGECGIKRSEGACWRAQRVVKLANLVMNETDVTASSNIPVIELCATVREGQSAIKGAESAMKIFFT